MSRESNAEFEPLRAWRDWFVESEKMWSDGLTEIMGDDRFAKSLGRSFQEMLHGQRIFSESMAQYLASLNLPARSDVLALGDRLGQIEDVLSALQVELRELRARLAASGGLDGTADSAPQRPPRTKRPRATEA